MRAPIIHAVCFHISYEGEDIPLQCSGAAALLYSADGSCQALGLALCRNALPRPGHARMAASQGSARHEALAASCVEAGRPLSSVCLCVYVRRDSGCESAIGPSCPCCEVQPQPVVWDSSQQRTGRHGRGEETPTKRRGNTWAVCVSADVPKCYGYSSIYPRFSTFPLPKNPGATSERKRDIGFLFFLALPHSLLPLQR